MKFRLLSMLDNSLNPNNGQAPRNNGLSTLFRRARRRISNGKHGAAASETRTEESCRKTDKMHPEKINRRETKNDEVTDLFGNDDQTGWSKNSILGWVKTLPDATDEQEIGSPEKKLQMQQWIDRPELNGLLNETHAMAPPEECGEFWSHPKDQVFTARGLLKAVEDELPYLGDKLEIIARLNLRRMARGESNLVVGEKDFDGYLRSLQGVQLTFGEWCRHDLPGALPYCAALKKTSKRFIIHELLEKEGV